jgi:hypothetical protein
MMPRALLGNDAALPMTEQFVLAAGSIVGREHVRLRRNNQDGLAVRAEDGLLVAVVTDGCSSGRFSEVGARLGALWLAEWLPAWQKVESDERALCTAVGDGLTGYLALVARGLRRQGRVEAPDVNDLLLFTFLAAVVDREKTLVIGLGDGVVSVDGKTMLLHSGPGNAPDYLAYRLVGSSLLEGTGKAFEPVVHHSGPTEGLESLLIGTDGAHELMLRSDEPLPDGNPCGGLEQFERDERLLRNPGLLHKRLAVIGEQNRRLSDDTTLALIRRVKGGRS